MLKLVYRSFLSLLPVTVNYGISFSEQLFMVFPSFNFPAIVSKYQPQLKVRAADFFFTDQTSVLMPTSTAWEEVLGTSIESVGLSSFIYNSI